MEGTLMVSWVGSQPSSWGCSLRVCRTRLVASWQGSGGLTKDAMIPGLHKALGAFFIDSCDWVVIGRVSYTGLLPGHSAHCTSATLVCLCLRKITKVSAFLMAGSYHRELISEVPCLERPSLAITSKVSSPLSQVASSFSEKEPFSHLITLSNMSLSR